MISVLLAVVRAAATVPTSDKRSMHTFSIAVFLPLPASRLLYGF
jgi:hypothetical protein